MGVDKVGWFSDNGALPTRQGPYFSNYQDCDYYQWAKQVRGVAYARNATPAGVIPQLLKLGSSYAITIKLESGETVFGLFFTNSRK